MDIKSQVLFPSSFLKGTLTVTCYRWQIKVIRQMVYRYLDEIEVQTDFEQELLNDFLGELQSLENEIESYECHNILTENEDN